MSQNRLAPTDFAPDALDALMDVFRAPGHVALTSDKGARVELPTPLFKYLMQLLRLMQEGRPIAMVPLDEEYTTQAAADYLGVSRQHLVDLLEDGMIPFHKVGTHRRVKFHHLLQYRKQRDGARREALGDVFGAIDDAGLYDAPYAGEDE
jgi:excisionase family DNA binding protein